MIGCYPTADGCAYRESLGCPDGGPDEGPDSVELGVLARLQLFSFLDVEADGANRPPLRDILGLARSLLDVITDDAILAEKTGLSLDDIQQLRGTE